MTPGIRFCQDVGGRSLAYAVHGTGPPLICTAWWVSHLERDWNNPRFRRLFEPLGHHFTVVRYDRIGVGLSDRDRAAYTLEAEVDELTAVADAALHGEPFHALAISCAGPSTISFAHAFPQRVRKLAFYGSYASGHSLGDTRLQQALLALIRADWGLGSRALADLLVPGLPREEVDRISDDQRYAATAESAARLYGMTFDHEVLEAAAQVTHPALVIHRREDRTVRFDLGRRLAATLPSATMVPLAGDAHVPWEGDVGEVLDALVGFLADDSQPPASSVRSPNGGANELSRHGDAWLVRYNDREVLVRHSKGMADLAVLLRSPRREFAARELASEGKSDSSVETPPVRRSSPRTQAPISTVLDGRLEAELEKVEETLRSAVDHRGRPRRFASANERARKAVTARIREAIARLGRMHPSLGEHLKSSIRTGQTCSYHPAQSHDWLVAEDADSLVLA